VRLSRGWVALDCAFIDGAAGGISTGLSFRGTVVQAAISQFLLDRFGQSWHCESAAMSSPKPEQLPTIERIERARLLEHFPCVLPPRLFHMRE
jgi:hypothetical protein